MKLLVPKLSGFCPGVKRAEKKIFEEKNIEGDNSIYIYGHLIHNENYIKFLKENDIITKEKTDQIPEGVKVAIRSHGIDKEIESNLRDQFNVVDLTCPIVKKLQVFIGEHSIDNYYIIICGKKKHPEVQGLISYAKNFNIIENEEDIFKFIDNLNGEQDELVGKGYSKILIVSQTTSPFLLYQKTCEEFEKKFSKRYEVKTQNSICAITSKKEIEALKLQKQADITFVVGDRISSNANKLYKIMKQGDNNTYFINDIKELLGLNLSIDQFKTALVVSSASTPKFIENEILEYLKDI